MGVIERDIEAVILLLLAVGADVVVDIGLVEDRCEIDALGLPVIGGGGGVEAFDMADHFIDRTETVCGHVLAQFFCDEAHEIDDVLGLAGEILPKLGVLGGDADWAGVLLADAHHEATHADEWGGSEAVFLCTEEGGDRDIAAGLELAVCFENDAAAQVVEE